MRGDTSRTLAIVEDEVALAGTEFRAALYQVRAEAGEVGKLAADLRHGPGIAGMLVHDEAAGAQMRALVENLDAAAERLASILGKVDGAEGTLGLLVNDPSAYGSMRDLFEGVQESWLLRGAVRDAEESGRVLRIQRWMAAKTAEEESRAKQ